MKVMDKVIRTNGDIVTIEPSNGDKYTLSELQKFVGGYIEMVPVGDKLLICNENGKITGMPKNNVATRQYCTYLFGGDYFAGDVIVIDPDNID